LKTEKIARHQTDGARSTQVIPRAKRHEWKPSSDGPLTLGAYAMGGARARRTGENGDEGRCQCSVPTRIDEMSTIAKRRAPDPWLKPRAQRPLVPPQELDTQCAHSGASCQFPRPTYKRLTFSIALNVCAITTSTG